MTLHLVWDGQPGRRLRAASTAPVVHSAGIASEAVVVGQPYSETCLAVPLVRRYGPVDEVAATMDGTMGDGKRPVLIFIA